MSSGFQPLLFTYWLFNFRLVDFFLPQFSVVAQLLSCVDSLNPMDCSTPGFPVLHCLTEFAQTHVHWVGDAIQQSHPLSPLLLLPSITLIVVPALSGYLFVNSDYMGIQAKGLGIQLTLRNTGWAENLFARHWCYNNEQKQARSLPIRNIQSTGRNKECLEN